MLRILLLGSAMTLSLLASTAVAPTWDISQGPEVTTHANAKAGLYLVWYHELGRWRSIGPLNWYDADMLVESLHRQGHPEAYREPSPYR
jgi:hypothetical protein